MMSDPGAQSGRRVVAVDVLRGLTIAGMILVNNPGSWSHIYPPLRHAAWDGWTPTDLVFPFFLFIVGVAISLALGRRVDAGDTKGLGRKIIRRGLVIFALGLFLAGFPFFSFEDGIGWSPRLASIRIPGVLQRIAVCYVLASLLFLRVPAKSLPWICAGLLVLYQALMTLVPVPGVDPATANPQQDHLSGWLDRTLLSGHLYRGGVNGDPEGLLSTLGALATTLFGVMAGTRLRIGGTAGERSLSLFAGGSLLVIAGYCWDLSWPINKPIWTSSYAVFTAGQACCALALILWITEVRGHRRWTKPFVIYGVNAITVFVMSGVLGRLLILIKLDDGEGKIALKTWIYRELFTSWLSPLNASLAYALCWVFAWFLVLAAMYRRNIVIKV